MTPLYPAITRRGLAKPVHSQTLERHKVPGHDHILHCHRHANLATTTNEGMVHHAADGPDTAKTANVLKHVANPGPTSSGTHE